MENNTIFLHETRPKNRWTGAAGRVSRQTWCGESSDEQGAAASTQTFGAKESSVRIAAAFPTQAAGIVPATETPLGSRW